VHLGQRGLVQAQHRRVGTAHDEERRGMHDSKRVAREVGTAAAGDNGSHDARPLPRSAQRGSCAGVGDAHEVGPACERLRKSCAPPRRAQSLRSEERIAPATAALPCASAESDEAGVAWAMS